MHTRRIVNLLAAAIACAAISPVALASSHREAPFTAANPTIDATDFYMFRSYGTEPAGDVTLIANYNPLQTPGGGPNYFALNQNAAYDINVDNDGDAKPNVVFRFRFTNHFKHEPVPTGNGKKTPIPLIISGSVGTSGDNKNNAQVNRYETYRVTMYVDGKATKLKNPQGGFEFQKPLDNIGNKAIPDYSAYAHNFMYSNVSFGNCGAGKVFVGQRHDGFVVNLGEVFDLVNTANPLGARNRAKNTLAGSNVTSIVVEAPASCLTADSKSADTTKDPVIGGWTTASLRQARILNPAPRSTNDAQVAGGPFSQVSRLGNPLVNELVIGLPDKDRFNASQPQHDAQFLQYVTHPSLPKLINILFGVAQPATPRNDLVAAFLTGLTVKSTDGNNTTLFTNAFTANADAGNIAPGEMLHLNVAYPAQALANQNNLGLLACQVSGYPNGRRPADDVVDIELNAAEGALTGTNNLQTCAPTGSGGVAVVNSGAVVNDGAEIAPTNSNYYISDFPYLAAPIPGSPNMNAMGTKPDQGQNQGGN